MELFKLFGTIAINNSDANKAIDETTGKASNSESKMTAAFKKIGSVIATYVSVKAIKDFGDECISMASDVEEMENKFNVVFDGMTEEVDSWASNYASAIGRNKNSIKEYLADNQNMFVGMGMTRNEAASLSENLVTLGLDLASFNNLSEDDAVNALSKALMGESEAAKTLGAVLNDNTLAMAMNKMGIEGKIDSLSEAEKMEVRYQAILMQSTDAVGDCERSLDSYKGRQIQLQSAIENIKESIGSALLPVVTSLLSSLTENMPMIEKLAQELTPLLVYACEEILPPLIQLAIEILPHVIESVKLLVPIVEWIINFLVESTKGIVEMIRSAFNIILYACEAFISLFMGDTKGFTESLKNLLNSVGSYVSGLYHSILGNLFKYVQGFFEKNISNVGTNTSKIVQIIGNKLSSIFQKVSSVFTNIKTTIKEKIQDAFSIVSGVVDKIKDLFNFKWKIPDITLPHFKITPSGWKIADLMKGTVPKLGIEWYANGGILNSPTIFGMNGENAMIGGEAGAEAVAPIETLQKYVSDAVASQNAALIQILEQILNAITSHDETLLDTLLTALESTRFEIKEREFARLVRKVAL